MASLMKRDDMKKDGIDAKDEVIETSAGIEILEKKTRISAVSTVIFSGIALLSDGYNASIVGNMNIIFGVLYPADVFTHAIKTRFSNAFLIGEIVGQLGFGFLIDKIGRKAGVFLTTALLIFGIILSAAAHGTTLLGMFWMLIVARGIAGVGAGGEYPVCGVSATEAADETAGVRKHRGFLIGMVGDFMIDFGFVLGGIVPLIVMAAFHAVGPDQTAHFKEGIWRTCFALGLVLPLFVFYFRWKMINSTAFRKNAMKKRIPYLLVLKRYWPRLIGTAVCWFLYDFVSYPFGLFSSTIISQLEVNSTPVKDIGYGTLINAFYLPGCVLGAWSMDRIGRKKTQFLGFFLQAILGFILGGALGPIQKVFPLFVVLYGIFVSLGEFGPGVATILISGESYPTAVRGHMLGLSAAVGKAGAAIGTQVFLPIQDSFPNTFKGTQAVFVIGSAFSLVGAIVTWFLIPEV
ncbi:MFS general substrate transporter, partial [Sistotremastrum suecicum HHB10207 ss-3]